MYYVLNPCKARSINYTSNQSLYLDCESSLNSIVKEECESLLPIRGRSGVKDWKEERGR